MCDGLRCMVTWRCMSVVILLFVVHIVLEFFWVYRPEAIVAIGVVDCVVGQWIRW